MPRTMIVNGYRIERRAETVRVLDSCGGFRAEYPRGPGAMRRACNFARLQRRG